MSRTFFFPMVRLELIKTLIIIFRRTKPIVNSCYTLYTQLFTLYLNILAIVIDYTGRTTEVDRWLHKCTNLTINRVTGRISFLRH